MYENMSPIGIRNNLAAYLKENFPEIQKAQDRRIVHRALFLEIRDCALLWHNKTGAPITEKGPKGEPNIAKELDELRKYHGCPGIPYAKERSNNLQQGLFDVAACDSDEGTARAASVPAEIVVHFEKLEASLERIGAALEQLGEIWKGSK